MNENKKIMILDTEVNGQFVYDIGFIIAEKQEDNTYKAIEKQQFIVEQLYTNKRLFDGGYYKKKMKEYIQDKSKYLDKLIPDGG